MALGGGGFGFQVGGQATDFVLLLMNDRAATSILKSKVKLGVTASLPAAPLDVNQLPPRIYSYVRRYFRTHGLGGKSATDPHVASERLQGISRKQTRCASRVGPKSL